MFLHPVSKPTISKYMILGPGQKSDYIFWHIYNLLIKEWLPFLLFVKKNDYELGF